MADKSAQKGEVAAKALRQVHAPRDNLAGFLFRIDPQPGGRVVVLVQSAAKPDWNYAFHNAGYLLAAPSQVRQFAPSFEPNQRLRFRLLANPVKRASRNSLGADGKRLHEKWIGKRVAVPANQLENWLDRHALAGGFAIKKDSISLQPGYVYFDKNTTRHRTAAKESAHGTSDSSKSQRARLRSVRFDGFLTVTDPERFCETLAKGIGPAKAFGFGLLSVARA